MSEGVGLGFQAAGTGMKFGGDLMSAASEYLAGNAKYIAHMQNAFGLNLRADLYKIAAGEEQKRGRQQAERRYMRLADDVGHIYSAAAGSGIDASSDLVKHVVHGNRVEAQSDAQIISDNAKAASNAATQNAMIARINAINERTSGKIARDSGKLAMVGGAFSAFGNMLSGAAGMFA